MLAVGGQLRSMFAQDGKQFQSLMEATCLLCGAFGLANCFECAHQCAVTNSKCGGAELAAITADGMLLAQLHACHLAVNRPTSTITAQHLIRGSRQHHQSLTTTGSRSSSTTTSAAAQPRRWFHAQYTSALGKLLDRNQLSQAVSLVETWLNNQQRVHGVATGELLEGTEVPGSGVAMVVVSGGGADEVTAG